MPVFYKRPDWAVKQIKRIRFGELIVEDVCEHGIGHPNKDWMISLPEGERKGKMRHGCDGCCKEK